MVYIREAHPTDGQLNSSKQFPIRQPRSMQERLKVAREFVDALKLSLPVLVDSMDDSAGKAYSAWPDRLYVIDANGKIALKGDPGPKGFRPAVAAAPGVLDRLTGTAR